MRSQKNNMKQPVVVSSGPNRWGTYVVRSYFTKSIVNDRILRSKKSAEDFCRQNGYIVVPFYKKILFSVFF